MIFPLRNSIMGRGRRGRGRERGGEGKGKGKGKGKRGKGKGEGANKLYNEKQNISHQSMVFSP